MFHTFERELLATQLHQERLASFERQRHLAEAARTARTPRPFAALAARLRLGASERRVAAATAARA